ncbi:hypothetical protein EA473_22225 [Natrarchaeobius chitinivorans]|uniref:Uncharacterized protein n=1 Tax=Natrarchaeobius chitinivorans TaxID=1679083 RepID=A0A3N6LKV1_NATCH|nr:hypothetical protein EA473_22225 [Natrarchaeobius chitinivorans]
MFLLFPWILLHELAHVVAALPWSTQQSITVFPPRASISFEHSSQGAMLVVGLAPTIAGYVLALNVLSTVGWPPWFGVIDVYLLLGWIVLSTPSPQDITAFRQV